MMSCVRRWSARRAPDRRAESIQRRARSAERRADHRSAAGASADAQHRGGDTSPRRRRPSSRGLSASIRTRRSSSWPTCRSALRMRSAQRDCGRRTALLRPSSAKRARIAPERKSLLFRISAAERARRRRIGRQFAGADGHRRLRRRAAEPAHLSHPGEVDSRRGTSASTCDGRCSTAGACGPRPPRLRRTGAPQKRACATSTRLSRWKCGSGPRISRLRIAVDRSGASRRSRRGRGAPRDRRAVQRRRGDEHRRAGRADRAAAGRSRFDAGPRECRARRAHGSTGRWDGDGRHTRSSSAISRASSAPLPPSIASASPSSAARSSDFSARMAPASRPPSA